MFAAWRFMLRIYMADIPTCLCQGSSWVVFAALYERHFTKRILANALRRQGNGANFRDFSHQIREHDGTSMISDQDSGELGDAICYTWESTNLQIQDPYIKTTSKYSCFLGK